MEEPIPATSLNDFIFCPVSIYFHRMYDSLEGAVFKRTDQINGSAAHAQVDNNKYSTSKDVITSLDGYSEEYNLICKIDIYNKKDKTLIERKKKIKQIFDGYVFQLYSQYFCLLEMGYPVEHLQLYSMDDNKRYEIDLPEDNPVMYEKFCMTLDGLVNFDMTDFVQTNKLKCENCIYEPACDRSLLTTER